MLPEQIVANLGDIVNGRRCRRLVASLAWGAGWSTTLVEVVLRGRLAPAVTGRRERFRYGICTAIPLPANVTLRLPANCTEAITAHC